MKAGGVVALTLIAVSLAYQLPETLEVDLGKGFPGALSIEGFHDAEGRYRWTRARSSILFRDPGATKARLELELSGFRPPGQPEPLVALEAGGESLRFRPSRRFAVYTLETRTRGLWSSDLDVEIRSETFSPGAGDERALGVRVHRARLVLDAGSLPSVRQLFLSAMVVTLLVVLTGSASGATAAGLAMALGYGLFRVHATLFVPLLALFLLALALTRWLAPSVERFLRDVLEDLLRRTVSSGRELACLPVASVVLAGTLGVFVSYSLTPHLIFDLGSGRSAAVTDRFGALDREGEITFRRALAGASLDLRDFGAGSPWTIAVRASASRNEARGTLLETDGAVLDATLSQNWETFSLDAPEPPWGWRGGRLLIFPGMGAGVALEIDRVEIDRGRSIPPLRAILIVLGASLAVIAAFRATGTSIRISVLGGALFLGLVILGIAGEPVLLIPFLPTLFLASVSAVLLAASSASFLRAVVERGLLPETSPLALTIALSGFIVAFVATASPLYVGGHYGFHTAIAEEIWQGQFLRYYLPYPGSMLSRQPQWEHVIVPHSCLYHTVAAPFAALPRFWFAALTKLFLATLVYAIAVASALVATRVRAGPAGAYAALSAAFLPTAYQLLGLGHLMTLFGAWAAALALGFIVIHADRLSEPSIFRWTVVLLTLCFLSYTGSLLFASLSLIAASMLLHRGYPDLVKRLATALGLAWAAAFLLYYIHWTWPFLSESLPTLLSGSSSDTSAEIASRLIAQPRKLAYTFGSTLIPFAGLLGLVRAETRVRRVLLFSWGGILIAFSLFDLWFNFLLKHHYFTYPVVATGMGLALAWGHEKGRLGRVIVGFFVVSILWMGFREALAVAHGGV